MFLFLIFHRKIMILKVVSDKTVSTFYKVVEITCCYLIHNERENWAKDFFSSKLSIHTLVPPSVRPQKAITAATRTVSLFYIFFRAVSSVRQTFLLQMPLEFYFQIAPFLRQAKQPRGPENVFHVSLPFTSLFQ